MMEAIAVFALFFFAEVGPRLNKERYDVLTILLCTVYKGAKPARTAWWIRRSESTRSSPKKLWKRRRRKKCTSVVDRFQIQESCRNPNIDTGWTEEFCKRLYELAGEDHSLHMVGKSAIRESVGDQSAPGADFSTIIGCFLFKKKNAVEVGHHYSVILRPDLQIRQRQGQQFQQHHEVPTGHAATGPTGQYTSCTENLVACLVDQGSGWINWWQFSASWSSSSNSWWSTAGEVSAMFRNFAKSLTYNGGFFERMEQLSTMFFSKFSFTSNSDSHVSDGWCKQHILYTHFFTVCGSRLSRGFKTLRGE